MIDVIDFELWKNKAVGAVVKAEKMLWGKNNEEIQTRMYELGFSIKTMRDAKLGWQVRNTKRAASGWGLSGCESVLLPEGIIIPVVHDGYLRKVAIWRMGHEHDGEIHVVEGSAPIPLILPGETPCCIVVKSEMDALLLHQELKRAATVVAAGDLTPDTVTKFIDTPEKITLLTIGTPLPAWEGRVDQSHHMDAPSLMALAEVGELESELANL